MASMKIPYLDLQAQYWSIKAEIDAAIGEVIDKSAFVLGPAVSGFEAAFATYCQSTHCIGVNNGTNALHLAMLATGVGPGDEVITAANTFIATAAAIAHTGARPVLVDVDPVTRNIDPNKIEPAITGKTKAILPVHLFGRPAPLSEILTIAQEHNLTVIEDAAQAHGAEIDSKRIGSFGIAAGFSFYPGKNLGAYGEGGAVTTSDDTLAEKIRQLRDHGSSKKYHHEILGYNARLEGIQGAVLAVKLKYLEAWTSRRIEIARQYNSLLSRLPVVLPEIPNKVRHVFHLYVIECEHRDALQAFLAEHGVPTIIHYPIPIHRQPAFASLGYQPGDFPVTEHLAGRILSLPIYAEMTTDQITYVAEQIGDFFDR
jgi:dTDP-4-amino-4,6-dideoxygalactose transaminase